MMALFELPVMFGHGLLRQYRKSCLHHPPSFGGDLSRRPLADCFELSACQRMNRLLISRRVLPVVATSEFGIPGSQAAPYHEGEGHHHEQNDGHGQRVDFSHVVLLGQKPFWVETTGICLYTENVKQLVYYTGEYYFCQPYG